MLATIGELEQLVISLRDRPEMVLLGAKFAQLYAFIEGLRMGGVCVLGDLQHWVSTEYCGRPDSPIAWGALIVARATDDATTNWRSLSDADDRASYALAIDALLQYCSFRRSLESEPRSTDSV